MEVRFNTDTPEGSATGAAKTMGLDPVVTLPALGAGTSIADVCRTAGVSRHEFDIWWAAECNRRVPSSMGTRRVGVGAQVTIVRDEWGIPLVKATSDRDLFFGYGYAMAQDRLFQMDYQRRLGLGRLAEILGSRALLSDQTARIIGAPGIAERELSALSDETAALLDAFADGVNALIAETEVLPIEFALLDYEPEPWRTIDCLAVAGAFRWYLTGRLPNIAIPELLKQELATTGLYRFIFDTERGADNEIIVPAEASAWSGVGTSGTTATDPDQGVGSNNWVVSGWRTASGAPIVSGDPHMAFGSVSCWYEIRLSGGSFDVGGMGYVGLPGILWGRNHDVAWTATNNLCSQRDLYREMPHPDQAGLFRYDRGWEPSTTRQERINVRDREPVTTTVTSTRNGPLVDALLPAAATEAGPVSLHWLGAEACDLIGALFRLDRTTCEHEIEAAVRGWLVPTVSLVVGDRHGHVGYQATGRLPIRDIPERGFRPGWAPEHQWRGLIPIEAMPRWSEPKRGWIGSANNRTAPDAYPYYLGGVWDQPYRARRIHQMIETDERATPERMIAMQQDVRSLRALECLPALIAALEAGLPSAARSDALRAIRAWDGRLTIDSMAASIFELFFARWNAVVASERIRSELLPIVSGGLKGTATGLLYADPAGWFAPGRRQAALRDCADEALDELRERLGPDPAAWTWGRLHHLRLRHVLSEGDLGTLLDRGDLPIPGDNATVFNTGLGLDWEAGVGSNFRIVADLASDPAEYFAIDAQGQSGHPGSAHYGDQQASWITARYRRVSWAGPAGKSVATLILETSNARHHRRLVRGQPMEGPINP